MRQPYRHVEDQTMLMVAVLVLAALAVVVLLVLLGALALGF